MASGAVAVVLVAVDVEVDGGVDHGQQVGEVLRAVHPHRPVHRPLHHHPVSYYARYSVSWTPACSPHLGDGALLNLVDVWYPANTVADNKYCNCQELYS